MVIHKSHEYIKYLSKKDSKAVEKLNRSICEKHGIIGNIFYSKTSGLFEVLSLADVAIRGIYYKIRFCSTGYETCSSKQSILRGNIKDYLHKSLYGVASYGSEYPEIQRKYPKLCKVAVSRWNGILRRIFDTNDVGYCRYGGAGVKLCDEWLIFSNFFNDIKTKLENSDLVEEFIKGNLHIDKDILQINIPSNKRIYSKDTVSFVTKSENNHYRDMDVVGKKNSNYFIVSIDGIETVQRNIRKYARERNLDSRRICEALLNIRAFKDSRYKFRYPTNEEIMLIDSGILNIGDII